MAGNDVLDNGEPQARALRGRAPMAEVPAGRAASQKQRAKPAASRSMAPPAQDDFEEEEEEDDYGAWAIRTRRSSCGTF